jgi:SAM-dependent methyltransferase
MKTLKDIYKTVSAIPQQTDQMEVKYFASLSGNSPLKVLDVGCAEGKLSLELINRGHEVTTCDFHEVYKNSLPNFVCCDIEGNVDMFGGKQFDVIYFMDVIEHLRNPVASVENLRLLLKDNGVLFINTPNSYGLPNLFRALRTYIGGSKANPNFFDRKNLTDLHFVKYDYWSLEKMLNFVGFRSTLISSCLARSLLLACRKVEPININEQIKYWLSLSK